MGSQLILRPPIGELTFQVYDRFVHPEFIDSLTTHAFERDGYQLRLHLTEAGHTTEWRCGDINIVEVLGDSSKSLPETGQLFVHRVGGERSECHNLARGVSYQTCFQVERVSAALYLHLDNELRDQSRRDGVIHMLSPHDRLGLSPLSYVDLQVRKGSLVIHAFHTFPSDYAIVKSQTLIETE